MAYVQGLPYDRKITAYQTILKTLITKHVKLDRPGGYFL